MEYIEELSNNELESTLIENLYEELSYLSEHPFDLNTITKSDLERFPFLSAIQIENLLYYIYKYGPLATIYELRNVESLDYQTIRYFLPFVYIGEAQSKDTPNLRQAAKYGVNELILRMNDCFQQKAGYKSHTQEEQEADPNKFYLGEKQYLSLRYGFQYKDLIQFGFVGEKDPGEVFWGADHKGFDFNSIHFTLRHIGILESVYLGDYRVSFGQGLVVNTDFSLGKTADVINIGKKTSGIKRHFSTNEVNFFRGSAVSLKLNQCRIQLFYSRRMPDATADSTTIFTFKTDGYHRIPSDLNKRHQAQVTSMGGHFQWRNESLDIGLTAMAADFGGKTLNPDLKPYNVYYLRGTSSFNVGINYAYQRKKYLFQGESAMSRNGGLATVNHFILIPASLLNVIFSYRNYGYNYQSLYGQSFGETSTLQNESGFYCGIKFFPQRQWELAVFLDAFRFPQIKYGIDTPSSGKDLLAQLTYRASTNLNMSLKYKFKEKEKNVTEKTSAVLPYNQHRWKYQLNSVQSARFTFKTQFDYNLYHESGKRPTTGWACAQAVGYKINDKKLQLDLSAAYFNATDWNNRIYQYEKTLLYAFDMPVLYQKGMRYAVLLKWMIASRLTFNVKATLIHYFNTDLIGSDLEEITGKEKSEINCLFKFKF